MNAIALGLGAALCWGTADVLARFAAQTVGAYRSLLYAQLVGAAALTLLLAARGELAPLATTVPPAGWAWGILSGVLFTGAALAFYHALETGTLALVSAIAGSYAAVTVALSVLSGERLTTVRALGIVVALAGVVLTSGSPAPRDAASEPAARPRGVGWAAAASLGFGVTFWLIGFRVTPITGGLASVWLMRATALALLLIALPLAAARPSAPGGAPRPDRVARMLVAVGVLDTLGFVANNVGTTLGLVSVVSVLGSLFGGVTVLIAWLVLGERLAPPQWLGVALILAGVAFVSG